MSGLRREEWRWFLGMAMSAIALSTNCAVAQITPDRTLPNNVSVTLQGNTFNINGGTQAGRNLFHSFQEFSVPTGSTASFNNAGDIQNIFSRVTGGSVSNIDGLIRASGTANLFLINPNGIIFGPHAQLNIGGSFFASTASSLKFADGFQFSATASQTTPLLTVSVPQGLQFGANPVRIVVQGDGQGLRGVNTELIDTDAGLRVEPNQTLALVGGDISLEGATLKTPGGRIELGSVGDNSLVSLTPINKGFSLGYDTVQKFAQIQLSQQAAVDASGTGGGDIQVVGSQVALNNGSQIEASTLGADKGGAMVVKATELLEIIGTSANGSFFSSLATQAYAGTTGNAGDLTIKTNTLLVRDGAQVSTSTFASGKGGNLTIDASDVQLIGRSADGMVSSGLFASALPNSTGDAGDLTITTNTLLLRDGAQVIAGTFGSGKGRNLTVNALDVQLIGTSANGMVSSGLATSAEPKSTGDAGDLTIKTNTLLVRDGAQVIASTFGSGKGGNFRVDALDVQLIGTSADGQFGSALGASALPNSTGAGGNLTINTGNLLVRDGAGVAVNSLGKGNAGNLTVNARSIRLDNLAILTANTQSINTDPNKQQATITLRGVRDLILRRGSKIIANAKGENVIGGNINIDAKNGLIVAVPQENSNISADSSDFRGGQVKINANGIFGTQFRNAPTPLSDITATGKDSSLNGTVQINTPDIDPSRGLVQLPTNIVETFQQIDTSCNPGSKQRASSFTITGRGGLPQSPYEPLQSRAVITDWVTLTDPETQHQSSRRKEEQRNTTEYSHLASSANPPTQIVEAQGWIVDKNGDVELVAQVPTATPHNPGFNPPSCHSSHK